MCVDRPVLSSCVYRKLGDLIACGWVGEPSTKRISVDYRNRNRITVKRSTYYIVIGNESVFRIRYRVLEEYAVLFCQLRELFLSFSLYVVGRQVAVEEQLVCPPCYVAWSAPGFARNVSADGIEVYFVKPCHAPERIGTDRGDRCRDVERMDHSGTSVKRPVRNGRKGVREKQFLKCGTVRKGACSDGFRVFKRHLVQRRTS